MIIALRRNRGTFHILKKRKTKLKAIALEAIALIAILYISQKSFD